jgi:hypothetical protein
MNVIETPWPHMVIDSYYPEHMFQAMRHEIATHIKNSEELFRLRNTKQIFYQSFDPDFAKIFPKSFECANSVSPYDMLKHFKEHRPYSKLSHYIEFNVIIDGYDYPIHDENPRKILSIVNYIAPENSTGTLIYDLDKTLHSQVDWEPNRSLIFPGITGKTWHAYDVQPKRIRITLNTFLVNDLA